MSEQGPAPDGGASAAELAALLAELQLTAEQLGSQLGDLGRLGAGAARSRAEQLPAAARLLELAPPELRGRLVGAATAGLSATRDLADWALTQLHPPAPVAEPEAMTIVRQPPPTIADVPTTWILTASVENHAATTARGFSVIGIKERNRRRAMEIEPGDVLVLYLTKVSAFAGAIRITGELFEERTKIWPGQAGKPDIYPWRFPAEPIVALPQEQWVPAASLKDDLEHVQKWPAEHWKLAFQGQLRAISAHDADLLLDRLGAAAPEAA